MAEDQKRVKPEHLSISAIVVAVVTGAGGLGLNVSSNGNVSKKLDDLVIAMVEVKAAIKSNDVDKSRIESELRELKEDVKSNKHEITELRQRLAVMESRQK